MNKPEGKYLHKSKEERIQKLKTECDKAEDLNYQKEFTKSELTDLRKDLGDFMIKLADLEDKLSETKSEFADKMSPVRDDIKRIVGQLRSGSRLVTEKCFKFVDRDGEKVRYYNEDGIMVHTRTATPQDLQFEIKHE